MKDIKTEEMRNVEAEYKFILTKDNGDRVFDNPVVNKYTDPSSSPEKFIMRSKYIDLEDESLHKAGFTYRLRMENDIRVATVKYGKKSSDGLHIRNEINIENVPETPDLSVFRDTEIWPELEAFHNSGAALRVRFGADFERLTLDLRDPEGTNRKEPLPSSKVHRCDRCTI